jgi:predicted outer membrane protein
LSIIAALVASGPAQAATPEPSGTASGQGVLGVESQQPRLLPADRALLVMVRQAGLWEMPAGRLAMTKGIEPRVREIGMMIADQHVRLDALDVAAANEVGVKLPDQPTDEQKRWLDELAGSKGAEFDQLFVQRLRVAHGRVFPVIAAVRVSTGNDTIRKLAQEANGFVLTHLSLLESTGLVQYAELPTTVAPATGPIAAAERRSVSGGIPTPLIWLILAGALVTGMVASSRLIRPRSFGGQRAERPERVETIPTGSPGATAVTGPIHTGAIQTGPIQTGPIPTGRREPDLPSLYPPPRSRRNARPLV